MPLPARQRAPFEVIEAEFVFQLLILLLDRPALMREADEIVQGSRARQMDEVVLGARRRPEVALREQPDLGREPALAPRVRRRDANRREARAPDARRSARFATRSSASGAPATPPLRRRPSAGRSRRQRGPRVRPAGPAHRGDGGRQGVPTNTLSVEETPKAYGKPARWIVVRSVELSPNSASPSTAVIRKPAARTWRKNVSACRHFS